MLNDVFRISSLRRIWRLWLRSESPRRAVINWSSPEKAGLIIVCFAVALISSWHLLRVPDISPGIVAPVDQVAPRDAEVEYRGSSQTKGAKIIQETIFEQ